MVRLTSTNQDALAGWPPRSARTGVRFSAHEVASELIAATLKAGIRVNAGQGSLAQFVSHSLPFTVVHGWPWAGCLSAIT